MEVRPVLSAFDYNLPDLRPYVAKAIKSWYLSFKRRSRFPGEKALFTSLLRCLESALVDAPFPIEDLSLIYDPKASRSAYNRVASFNPVSFQISLDVYHWWRTQSELVNLFIEEPHATYNELVDSLTEFIESNLTHEYSHQQQAHSYKDSLLDPSRYKGMFPTKEESDYMEALDKREFWGSKRSYVPMKDGRKLSLGDYDAYLHNLYVNLSYEIQARAYEAAASIARSLRTRQGFRPLTTEEYSKINDLVAADPSDTQGKARFKRLLGKYLAGFLQSNSFDPES